MKNTLNVFIIFLIVYIWIKATESEAGDMDLSGLPETAVDSEDDDDEEDIERASDPLMSRDIVRDCLEKDPIDRTDDDIGKYCSVVKYCQTCSTSPKLLLNVRFCFNHCYCSWQV